MISKELEGQIIRLYKNEKWKVGSIAKHFRVHPSVVTRVLGTLALNGEVTAVKNSKLDPFMPFIREQLEKYPHLTASRLFQMTIERGYDGKQDWFRQNVRRIRPTKKHEAFLRRTTLKGEEGQVDWGHFGRIKVGSVERQLMAFVMVLAWSRQVFLRFYLSQEMSCFLDGHEKAFEFFCGIPRQILYDNLKTAVLEHHGNLIKFNETFLLFCAHHRFEPKPCGVRRANEKGRVERAIGYVRTSFFAGRIFKSIDDLNTQAHQWCVGLSGERKHPDDETLTVNQALKLEQEVLLPCRDNPFSSHGVLGVRIGRTPFARIDGNDYSVPCDYVRTELSVFITPTQVIITQGNVEVARHPRSWGRGERVEDPLHLKELLERKKRGQSESVMGKVEKQVPSSKYFIEHMHQSGANIGSVIQSFLRCIEQYGEGFVEIAVARVLTGTKIDLHTLRLTLDRLSHEQNRNVHIIPFEPLNKKAQNIKVTLQPLTAWDKLSNKES